MLRHVLVYCLYTYKLEQNKDSTKRENVYDCNVMTLCRFQSEGRQGSYYLV